MAEFSFSLKTLQRWGNYVTDGASGMVFEMVNRMSELRDQGVGETAIRERMLADFAAGGAGYGNVSAKLNTALDSIQRNAFAKAITAQTQRLAAENIDGAAFVWHAMGVNTCIDCGDRHGEIKTYAAWQDVGLPQTGTTRCNYRCKCQLIREDRAVKMFDAKNPRALQAEMRAQRVEQSKFIQSVERQRGADYAKSTFEQKLGQWKRREFAEKRARNITGKTQLNRLSGRQIAEMKALDQQFAKRIT